MKTLASEPGPRAKLRANACVKDIDFRASRGLDRNLVRPLANDSAGVRRHENVFLTGPQGLPRRLRRPLYPR